MSPKHSNEPLYAEDISSLENPQGLSQVEVARRLQQYGPNILPRPKPHPMLLQLGAQMFHFFALMLWIAGLLAIVAGMPQLGIAIFVVIILNGIFAFAQEYRAERAADRLRDLVPRHATVVRDGAPTEIDAAELVPGDLVLLKPGDRISADLLITEAHNCTLDASTLTGESIPSVLVPGQSANAGTFLVQGEANGRVTATGYTTRLARIVQLTRAEHRPRAPLALELDRVVRIIATAAVSVGIVFMAVAAVLGMGFKNCFLFAIGVTVALVPEGLLPTVSLSLAIGAQRMARRNALVRRLESVETLGSTTFICTDKTGTLTRNEMAVVEVWMPSFTLRIENSGYDPKPPIKVEPVVEQALRKLARTAVRASSGRVVAREGRWVPIGDPMDAALDVLARRLGIDVNREQTSAPVVRRLPFDSRRRRMSVVATGQLFLKGAPDAVFPNCSNAPLDANEAVSKMAARGLRVIAVADRCVDENATTSSIDDLERDLCLLGLVGMQDPPREGVTNALSSCRRAQVRVGMITGDHPETARAIAEQIGLLGPDKTVLMGSDLPRDIVELGNVVDHDGIVISRVTPEDKLRIARALQSRGHVVAMTGDGVNDGPALEQADIGVAMGRSGTDVAREAADLVLLDDDFATIVAAVEEGRATFFNVRRFLTYHLTDNIAELAPFVAWAITGGKIPLALGVLQVLSLDIGTDLLPAIALGAEPPHHYAIQKPVRRRHVIDRALLLRAFGLLGPIEACIEMTAFLLTLTTFGWRFGSPASDASKLAIASGAAFTAVVIGQMGNALACRSETKGPGALGWTSNPLLVGAIGIELLLLFAFLYVTPVARLLGQAPPNKLGLAVALLAAPAVLAADTLYKRWRRRATRDFGDETQGGS